MKIMKDYPDSYLKYDVLLLVNVFGKFRNNNIKNYGLRTSHYLSAPGLSSDAKFNITKVVIELIPVFTFTYFLKKV